MNIIGLVKYSFLLVSIWSLAVNAIVIRHDVPNEQYLALGEKYSESVAYIGGCAATLVDPEWIVTAAHCLHFQQDKLFFVKHLDSQYRIKQIFLHPQFKPSQDEVYDIALVQLKDPIRTGKPALLYQEGQELGLPVIFVGRGSYGDGLKGPWTDDYQQRGATNTVDHVSENLVGFTFNPPVTATELEGISSRGDSGGPAFIEQNEQLHLIGVSSYQEGNGFKEGRYGVGEYYTRVSAFYPWLQRVIKQTPAAQIAQHKLIDAVKNNDLVALKSALDKQVLNNIPVLQEAFYQSVMLNRLDAAQALLIGGADIKKISFNQRSLFEFALSQKQKDYVKMLQQQTINMSDLHAKHSSVLALFIDRFSDDSYLLQGVKRLIEQDAAIDAQTNFGDTALIIAGWRTHNLELVELLINSGANLDIANNNGDTALMDAAYLGKLEHLQALLTAGANAKLQNKRGKTALDLAKKKGHAKAVAALERAETTLKQRE